MPKYAALSIIEEVGKYVEPGYHEIDATDREAARVEGESLCASNTGGARRERLFWIIQLVDQEPI